MVSFTYNVMAFKNHLSLSLVWTQKCQHVLSILLCYMLIADVIAAGNKVPLLQS